MNVNFTITTKNPKNLAEALVSEIDSVHSGGISYYTHLLSLEEKAVRGIISFNSSYQASTYLLKEKAIQTIKSILYPYAFVNFDDYDLFAEVDEN